MITEYLSNRFGIHHWDSPLVALGLVNTTVSKSVSFLDDMRFHKQLCENLNVVAVIVTSEIAESIRHLRDDLKLLISDDPRFDFYTLQNHCAKMAMEARICATVVDASAKIHPSAQIAANNVIIGGNVTIEPNVTILRDVEIGEGTHISAGSVIGAEGFEHKRTSKGILSVVHDGKVIIGESVFIGALNAISKGFSFRDTMIGSETKTDNLVHIAHGAQIGERCFLPASCMIAGSVSIGNDVWIGPNASISSQVVVGDNAFITLGAVVTRDVPVKGHVSGNFAIDHQRFMNHIKEIAGRD